ncbi:V-type proton ATPase subunit F-like [Cucumis melo var. makuwa]|uniref:V-type proton ATPase subunit F-like n=1 Tax=Cucumis melo var. makuwa TaxID=1194695 RepID=A0A5D3C187_CUCMM|nr:V-type proton ATPase subunit F-like [Cucumis melo var. makuwa]
MSIVLDALKTRNLEIKKERKDGEILIAKRRSDKKNWKRKEKSSMMNSNGEARKRFLCHKGHFKQNCPLNKSKDASSSKHADSEANVTNGKVMGGKVLLGDNGTCEVKGTGSGLIATHDGMIRMLINVRHVLELKRNLISLGELDRSVSGSATKALKQQKQQIVDHVVTDIRVYSHQAKSQQERILIDEGVCSDNIASDLKKQRCYGSGWFKQGGDSKPRYKAKLVAKVLPAHRFKYRSDELKINSG